MLKNNSFLILVNRACSLSASLLSADGQQPPEVGWCLSAEDLEDDEEGPVNSGPPGPLRGISSSLQGVWQACSPNNCSCSLFTSPECRQSATTTTNPCPARAQCPLVSVSGWQSDLTEVITTLSLPPPRPSAAVMTWSGRTITSRAGQHPLAPGAWLLASCPSFCQLL